MILEIFEAVLILLISVHIWQTLKKPSNYPPGPWGLPLIGSIPLGFESFSNTVLELRKQYSDIISWRIGTQLIVVLFDCKLAKEAFQHPEIAYRPDAKVLTYVHGDHSLGIIATGGVHIQNNRRFALRHLRDFGMGKSKLVSVAHHEADKFVLELKKQIGNPAPVPHSLTIAILNIVWQMVGSRSYEYNDEEMLHYCKLISDTQIFGSKLVILDIFPWIKKILPQFLLNAIFKLNIQSDLSNHIKKFFMKRIDEHIQDLDEHNPKDYIDAYLIEMKKQESNPESTMSIEDLQFCMSDLFEGGTETTSLSLHWSILYLAKYSKIQNRLQKEIDEFLPKGTSFCMEDKTRLSYTEAFVHEILRYSSISRAPPREANSDVTIGNFLIPKGSFIILQSLMMHYDSRYYDKPEEFRPERFLNSEGKFVAPKEGFVPFGYGNRVCIGEAVARMELFVFITKFVQNFHFEFPPGEEFDMEAIISPIFRPPKGSPNVILTLR